MIPSDRKPIVRRPSGDTLPEVSSLQDRRERRRSGGGAKSLLGSIGIHAVILLVIGGVTYMNLGSGDSAVAPGDSAAGSGFEMVVSASREPATPREPLQAQPVSFVDPTRKVVAVFPELQSSIELPPLAPISSNTATPPAPAANPGDSAATTASKSPGKSSAGGGSGTRGTGKSASGRGSSATSAKPTSPPKLLSAPPPRYPAGPKAANITGRAAVLIQVRADGSAGKTSLYRSSGNKELDQAAVTAASGWKFSANPSLGAGQTIPVIVHVTFAL